MATIAPAVQVKVADVFGNGVPGVAVSLAYLAGGTLIAPELWADPLGPLVKVVPAIVLTVAWGATIVGFLGQIDGAAAWEQAASTGGATITIARRGARSATDSAVISAHEQELTRSLTNAERFGFLSRQGGVALLVLGTLLLAILTFLASRAAGHLSRQLSRPLTELVRWTALIRRGEPLPTSDGRGAPEFEVLRARVSRDNQTPAVIRAASARTRSVASGGTAGETACIIFARVPSRRWARGSSRPTPVPAWRSSRHPTPPGPRSRCDPAAAASAATACTC